MLSNGRFTSLATARGTGGAFFDGEALTRCETSVAVGTGGELSAPAALRGDAPLGGEVGALRDPCLIKTPSGTLDRAVNGWLLYQTIACRLWARSALYQSGGAFGFRDQLQDAASLVLLAPERARAQILLHAAHQFVEGDVLHWWHPPDSRGIRTRFADDLLWLPYLKAHYMGATGDDSILDEKVRFLTARRLEPGEDEAFVVPGEASELAGLYEHCVRAIDRSLAAGAHALPLFGTGDWNDSMNRVGHAGRGESVWMGFFLFAVLRDFERFCRQRGDSERGERYFSHRKLLQAALAAAWDGEWYLRGYHDDGEPLGSHKSEECRIDAPFDRTPRDPGYVKGYLPGVRENGGQYTHAALWVVCALAEARLDGNLLPREAGAPRIPIAHDGLTHLVDAVLGG
jgi:cyclic beta-1,2-glucan synthetase